MRSPRPHSWERSRLAACPVTPTVLTSPYPDGAGQQAPEGQNAWCHEAGGTGTKDPEVAPSSLVVTEGFMAEEVGGDQGWKQPAGPSCWEGQ